MNKRKLRRLINKSLTTSYHLLATIKRRFRLRTWVAIAVAFVLLPIIFLTIYNPHKAEAEWFDDYWSYRQSWSFTHNAALTDRRVTFTISNTNTLISAGKMQANCADVRFTDGGGKLLRIQLTGTCNSASTTYDVIIPNVLNGVNAGYLYYGNTSAPSVSEDISSFTSLAPSGGAPTFGSEAKAPAPAVWYKFDEGTDSPTGNTEQQIELMDTSTTSTSTTYGPTDHNLGLSHFDSADYTGDTVYFEATIKNTNTTTADVGISSAISCPSSDNCKIAVQYTTAGDLYFIDCDDEQCLTKTTTLLDGGTGCVLTGCATSGTMGGRIEMYCPSTDNCKIAYQNTSGAPNQLKFADCDTETCSSGTDTVLDGASCVLSGCDTTSTHDAGNAIAIDCTTGTNDCKIAEVSNDTSVNNDDLLIFIDCNSETCASGTYTSNLDGTTSCKLTGCTANEVTQGQTKRVALKCLTTNNCKILYRDDLGTDLRFADCDNAACSTGTSSLLDGGASCTLSGNLGDGCSTTSSKGLYFSLSCPASDDCKVVQTTGARELVLGDCDTETCAGGTASQNNNYNLDGWATGNRLTGADVSIDFENPSVFCVSATDCKISYYAQDVTRTGLRFADCNDAGCNAGTPDSTTTYLDGYTTCGLTDCATGDDNGNRSVVWCVSSTNCKVVYYDTTNANLKFADCDNTDCTSGTVYTTDTGGFAQAALYSSGGTEVTGANVTSRAGSYATVRSAAISQGTLPALQSNIDYEVRIKTDVATNTTASIQSARLIVLQNGVGTKLSSVETQIEVGNKQSAFANTTYTALTDLKVYKYDKDQFFPSAESSGDIELHATGTTDSTTDSVEIGLFNKTDNTQVAQVSITPSVANTFAFGSTINVDGSANWDQVNDDDYEVRVKCTDGADVGTTCSGSIANTKIVFKQVDTEGIAMFETSRDMINTATTQATATYTDKNFLTTINPTNNSNSFSQNFFEATLKTSNAVNAAFAQLKNDSDSSPAAISNSAVSDTSTTYIRKRSTNSLNNDMPTASRNFDTQIKNNSTDTTTVSVSRVISQVRGIRNRSALDNENVVNGDIYSATWQTEDQCVRNKCLYFDGINDFVDVPNMPQVDLDGQLSGAVTFSAWVKVTDDGENNVGQIFSKGTTTYLRTTNKANGADLEASLDLATTDATLTITDSLPLNEWHHVAVGYTDDADDEITVYIDGKSRGSSVNGSGAPAADLNDVFIGGSSAANFHGYIDNFKIYKSERTNPEVLTDFIKDSGRRGSQSTLGATDTSFLTDGLVGYWKMEEAATPSVDSSGNGANGTWSGNVAQAAGKFGFGTSYDGVNDHTSMADNDLYSINSTNKFTVSLWANFTSVTGSTRYVISKRLASNYEWSLGLNTSGNVDAIITNSAGTNILSASSAAQSLVLSTGTWYHLLLTTDLSKPSLKLFVNGALMEEDITSSGGTYTNGTAVLSIGEDGDALGDVAGTVDDVRLYKRDLSQKEVVSLYNWAAGPIRYWSMDENTGSKTYDLSSNGTAATLNSFNFNGNSGWASGKYGSALKFDGATGLAQDDQVSTDYTAHPTLFTEEFWVYPQSTGEGALERILDTPDLRTFVPANQIEFQHDFTGGSGDWVTSANSLPFNTWSHVAITYDNTSATNDPKFYINGVLQTLATDLNSTGTPLANTGTWYIGNNQAATRTFDGSIDDVKIYNYIRTIQQIIEDMNGGHPTGGSPIGSQVAYWKFDEQQGQTINNTTTTALTAVRGATSISEATDFTWKTKENCKVNGCGDYDGIDDVTTVTNADAIDIDIGLNNGFTMATWINPDTAGEGGSGQIFQKGAGVYCTLGSSTPFSVSCNLDYITTDAFASVSSAAPATTWTHVAVTFNKASNKITVWINGQPRATSSAGVGGLSADTSNLLIGGTTTNNFDGRIDEFQIYSSELTTDQMNVTANFGAVNNFGTGTDEATQITGGAGNPPTRYWNLNENTGSSANDISGNGTAATLTSFNFNANSGWVPGKYGSALMFDGASGLAQDDQVSTDYTGHPTTITEEYWVYPQSIGEGSTGRIIETTNLWTFVPGTLVEFQHDFTGGAADWTTSSNSLPFNTWSHVAITYDNTSATNDPKIYINGILQTLATDLNSTGTALTATGTWYIGNNQAATRTFDGIIDDVKIYDYVRTQAQISYDYNRGRPVGWWKMDECSGGTANDNSGNSLSGTWSGPTGTNATAGACNSGSGSEAWNNGTTGKRNASLSFDGTDDVVTVTNVDKIDLDVGLSGDFSISAWVKATSAGEGSGGQIFFKGTSTAAGNWLRVDTLSGSNLDVEGNVDYATTDANLNISTAITTGTWNHIVMVFTNSTNNFTIWINGVNKGTSSTGTGARAADTSNLLIGGTTTDNFNGQIDDFRIYNYAFSSKQILKLMQDDAGARFGPTTGSP